MSVSSKDSSSLTLLACALALFVGACAQTHDCGSVEICDYADNDCDGPVDEHTRAMQLVNGVQQELLYATKEHCGACGLNCDQVFVGAEETACIYDDEQMVLRCELVRCPEGTREVSGGCVPESTYACLPCELDDDCTWASDEAICSGGRCTKACVGMTDCASLESQTGFAYACADGVCVPAVGCTCNETTVGASIACLLENARGELCAGEQLCKEDGFASCQPALAEACNGADDDCDDAVDEDFRNSDGLYVDVDHCGACASPCVAPGPNMAAACDVVDGDPTCSVACLEGFVDVDGFGANGCECERWDGVGPPPSVDADIDCDGVVDNSTDFVFVTPSGNDAASGSLLEPMRTLEAAVLRGRELGRDVLVAGGVYEGPVVLQSGVSVFGGYRADFRDRDISLYPVTLEGGQPGRPLLEAHGIDTPTTVDGILVIGSAGLLRPATGDFGSSTAVWITDSGTALRFVDVEVYAGPAQDGVRGRSSAEGLADLGYASLEALNGENGRAGVSSSFCDAPSMRGGAAGVKVCAPAIGGVEVSGGRGADAGCPPNTCVVGQPCGNTGCPDYISGGVCDIDAVLRDARANPPPQDGRGFGRGRGGEVTYNAPTNRGVCNFCDDNPTLARLGVRGGDGQGGVDGSPGTGCTRSANLDDEGLLRSGAGTAGMPGTHGAGGGGGSSGSGYMVIDGTEFGCEDRPGGSGGGGGSGGCGAPGTQGGAPGGNSVGIAIRGPSLPTLERVRVVTARGGNGGDGGDGSAGGAPGSGASGGFTSFWCARQGGRGGDGGRGGASGGGGGGCGGHSTGVVIDGAVGDAAIDRLRQQIVFDLVGSAGRGGRGGSSPVSPGSAGRDGQALDILATQ